MSLDVYLKADYCKCCGLGGQTLFSSNITHNLNKMAAEAGIYEACWRPEESSIEEAEQLIKPLSEGLELLKSDPERFKKFNSPNGWGMYEHFVIWVEEYLEACEEYPEAIVEVWR